ncbi:right-handed parallel beta-helix repeat-containing protein [Pontibacter beigongshangensis]|uniref:right-handed parallel beta-helix repeat-containing protein n=1 Tax=Pontibacter beigongshangensis TaxID=2574733 RepID=UPI001F50C78A|nr:right-handed parallel beta-helix repeat-containing protein [Pontibacter beigongshangensis]
MHPNKKQKLLLFAFLFLFSAHAYAADIWVSPKGSDQNAGTKASPMASPAMALRKARDLRRLSDPSVEGGIRIIFQGGVYELYEPLLIRPEDSGTAASPTTFEAAPGENPVFSGGVKVTGWKKANGNIPGLPNAAKGNVWVADLPKVGGRQLEFRQLWVNDQKATRATNLGDGVLDRILAVDGVKQEMWIPTPKVKFNDIDQLEFIIHQWWAIANLRVKSIKTEGNRTKLTFHQPESLVEFEHPWPAPFIDDKKEYNGNSAFFFADAIELLNQPGEWFANKKTGKLYYWPRQGENMSRADVEAPYLETIVQVKGNLDNPVQYVNFKGIRFEHTTWMRPSEQGHVPLQAGWYLIEAYKLKEPGTPDKAKLENQAWVGRQPAGMMLTNAKHISIERCVFTHMAATGLDFVSGVHHSRAEGNVFSDIGGTGVQAGFFGSEDFEAHLPYDPTDRRELVHHIQIANNLITDATNEDWGAVGISIGFAHDINIEHNEVSHLNYSGICVGWGWTRTVNSMRNNRVHANHIHHFAKQMYDVGGIYMLGSQPNTEVSENAIHDLEKAPYAHMLHHYQYIYFDEGSSYIRAVNNWTEVDKFFSNSPGPGNLWENNGPQVDEAIKKKAGIKPEFQDIKKDFQASAKQK